jgi:hypothetical protein
MVHDVVPAAELVQRLVAETEQILAERPAFLLD